jgi:AsmA protein
MKRSTKIVVESVIFVLAVVALIPLIVGAEKIRPALERQFTTALGRNVKLGDLSFSVFSRSLVARDVSIADDPGFSAAPFLTAKEVRIGVSLGPLLFSRQVKLRSFRIETPQINVIRAANGTWNFSSIGHAAVCADGGNTKSSLASIPDLSVGRIRVEDGRVAITTLPAHGEPGIYDDVNFTAQNFSLDSQFSFELDASLPSGGTLTATGRLGRINRNDAATSPADAQISVKNVDPISAGFLNPDAGLSFLANVEMHGVSDGQTLGTKGTIHLQNLKLRKGATAARRPIDLAYTGAHRLKENTGEIQDATIQVSDTAIHVNGTYQIAEMDTKGAVLNLKITGQNLPMDDLQMLMAAAAVRLPNGSLLKGAVIGQEKSLVIAGPITVENTRQLGFDVGSIIHGIAALSGVETGDTTQFKKLSMNVRLTNPGTTVNKIDAEILAMGEVSGIGSISPDDYLDFKLVVIGVKAKGVGKVGIGLLSVLSGSSGATAVPMRVTGTSEEPSITADVGGLVQKQTKSFFNNKK